MSTLTNLIQQSIYNLHQFPSDKVREIESRIAELEPSNHMFIVKLMEHSAARILDKKLMEGLGWVGAMDNASTKEDREVIVNAAACSLLVAIEGSGIPKPYTWWKEQTLLCNDLTYPVNEEIH